MKAHTQYCSSLLSRLVMPARKLFGSLTCPKKIFLTGFLLLLALAGSVSAAPANNVISNDCLIVVCPDDQVVYTCSDVVVPNRYPIVVSNLCATSQAQLVCQPPIGTPLGLGTHPIHCVVFANGAVFAQCDFNITVLRDLEPPQIQCPPDQEIHACIDPATGACGAVVNYPAPIATDNSGSVFVVCNPPSGSFFPCGSTAVTCTAFDRCENQSSCQFKVTVLPDGQPPQIRCPDDLTVTTCSNSAVVTYPFPVVIPAGTTVVCFPPSGSAFPLGLTTVICTASNPCGETKCSFNVIVRPEQPAAIQCPTAPIIVTAPCGSNCVPVLYPVPAVSGGTLIACNPPSGFCFPLGDTFVVCRAKNDCGDVVGCEFLVRVIPGQGDPPVIQCPASLTAITCSNCAVVSYLPPVVLNGVLVGCNPPPGTCFPLGVTTVTCLAVNPCGHAECKFDIVVRPVPPAAIQCPTAPIIVTAPCGSNCVPVLYPTPIVIGGTLIGCNPPSGFCFPLGDTVVSCRAKNDCGDVVGCEFLVRVIPGQGDPPAIQCPANITVVTCSNCAPVTYPLPVVLNGVLVGCNPPPGTCFPIGVTTVTCLAVNPCGKAECKFDIVVRPVPPAAIQCPTAPIIVTAPCGSNCVPVLYPVPAVSGGTLIGCNPPSGFCFPLGDTVVSCRAKNDCGDVVGCEFLVRVIPGQTDPPVIHCPQDIVVETCSACQVVNYPAPVVLNGALVGCNPPSGTCFPPGVTIVTCKAANDCGSAECKFTITVREVPRVQIQCPDDITLTTCGNGEVVNYPKPTLLGAVDPTTVSIVCNPPPGTFFPLGTNKVVCCVTDRCDRRDCCSFNVIVLPGAPCLKPPLNMVLWLPFDEPAGVIAKNLVAGAPNGIHINGPVPLPGQKVLNSLCFDGINDFVRVPNYAAILLGTQNFSIDCWALPRITTAANGRHVIVSKMSQVPGAIAGYEYYLDNAGVMNLLLRTPLGGFNFNSGVAVPLDNAWHLLAVTVQRSAFAGVPQARFYLDGMLVAVVAGGAPGSVSNSSPLYVGASTWPVPNGFFRGYLDEVEIFNRILTAAEIQSLWLADRSGKCKLRCSIPWDVSYRPGSNYVTVLARICNDTPLPQPVNWVASGPMPIPTPAGVVVIPPFSCVNIPIQLCRPTNGQPVGAVVKWTLSVFSGNRCPIICIGSVINPGPIIIRVPIDVVDVPGTRLPRNVRIGLDGLPPGIPVRLRVTGPDMEPDMSNVSLNGLPPGVPWIFGGSPIAPAADGIETDVSIKFVEADPIGLYTILLEADVDGDGTFDTLASFDVDNPVVSPPVLIITRVGPGGGCVTWEDEGDGILEGAKTVDGPWDAIPNARPGYMFDLDGPMKFFRVFVPDLQ